MDAANRWMPSWLNDIPFFNWDSLREERESMSSEERRRVLQEKFGFEGEIVETPDLISELLLNLEEELDRIDEKEAYETALFITPDHVTDKNFLVAFLRASLYDIREAAQRLVTYWSRKVELFGTEVAFKPYLSLVYYKEEDHVALVKCALHVLPHRDDFGRAIIFSLLKNFDNDVDSMLRLLWYIMHEVIFQHTDGENVQRKGFVYIGASGLVGRFHPFDSIISFENYVSTVTSDTHSALPVRIPSLHLFATNSWSMIVIERLLLHFGRNVRARLNFYIASEEKKEGNLRLLSSCGMERSIVPTEIGGETQQNSHEWLMNRLSSDLCAADAGQD
mmetsp:Transcript_16022/g.22311  ORF Transcript_16022/g.22311 Transcript_16022/m.22311 type:complete len:335 (-) Transcript_16022:116-1120(-)